MGNRVFRISENYIRFLYVLTVVASLLISSVLIGFSLKPDVTFDPSFVLLLAIFASVIFITLTNEGHKIIEGIKERKIELTESRLLIQREDKRVMIFFDELEDVTVLKDRQGRVKEITLMTADGTCEKLRHFDGLKELAAILSKRMMIRIRENSPMWYTLGMTGLATGLFFKWFFFE